MDPQDSTDRHSVPLAPRLTRRTALLRIAGAGTSLALVTAAPGAARGAAREMSTHVGSIVSAARAQEGTTMTEATSSTGSTPTVVLVHGAFADASSWNGVIPTLLERGCPVVSAANPLRGVAGDAEYVASVLAGIPGPIVLVGHSYGGMVITGAALGNDNVKALVYVAGFAPDAGESAVDLSGRFPGGSLGETLAPIALPEGGNDLYIQQDKFWAQFAADVPEADAKLMAATQRPATEAALNDASGEPAWTAIPSWFIYGELDKNIPAAALAFMAERAGSKATVEVPGASHVVMVSHPRDVAEMILTAVAATG